MSETAATRLVPGAPPPVALSKSQKKKRKTKKADSTPDSPEATPDVTSRPLTEQAPENGDAHDASTVAAQEPPTPAAEEESKTSPVVELVSKRIKATAKKITRISGYVYKEQDLNDDQKRALKTLPTLEAIHKELLEVHELEQSRELATKRSEAEKTEKAKISEAIAASKTTSMSNVSKVLDLLRLRSLFAAGQLEPSSESGVVFVAGDILLGDDHDAKQAVLSGLLSAEGELEGISYSDLIEQVHTQLNPPVSTPAVPLAEEETPEEPAAEPVPEDVVPVVAGIPQSTSGSFRFVQASELESASFEEAEWVEHADTAEHSAEPEVPQSLPQPLALTQDTPNGNVEASQPPPPSATIDWAADEDVGLPSIDSLHTKFGTSGSVTPAVPETPEEIDEVAPAAHANGHVEAPVTPTPQEDDGFTQARAGRGGRGRDRGHSHGHGHHGHRDGERGGHRGFRGGERGGFRGGEHRGGFRGDRGHRGGFRGGERGAGNCPGFRGGRGGGDGEFRGRGRGRGRGGERGGASMSAIDYSVYLVTGRDLLPRGKVLSSTYYMKIWTNEVFQQDYYQSLEESLQGGVTLVQIREKNADTGDFIEIASKSKEICDRYKVPIIINDRVDVAIAINARGVHLGQTDMSVAQARKLLPKGMVIGVSCNNAEHVRAAIKDGADSIGIGAVWGTQTKKLTSPIVGVRGVGSMLEILDGSDIKAVAIGGIKSTNLLRTLHGSVSRTGHALDGVAIVSEIMASENPRQAAETLSKISKSFTSSLPQSLSSPTTADIILERVSQLMSVVRDINPLVHQITNTVVATQSANITLSLGGSPIMATEPQEMEDMSRICSALLINIGTMRFETKESMLKAGFFANENTKPVVFDPVGVGASAFRKETVRDLLNTFQASVIKGNAGELAALAESQEVLTKGVDSIGPGFKDPVTFVRELARKERCVIALTGPVDYISDGISVVALRNGHDVLGKITGSGCIVGSSIATYCGALFARSTDDMLGGKLVRGDVFLGAIAGILLLTVAAEVAAQKKTFKGPGTFLPALIDELWILESPTVRNLARIEVF
ncbi:hypothetical protein H0H93_016461 [Arthromyces matolae]|nr:hypothetical protein H0H93_016461 [Arthromyces matolae]